MNQKLFSYNSNLSLKKFARSFIIPIGGKLCNERMVTLRKRGKKKKREKTTADHENISGNTVVQVGVHCHCYI